MGKWSYAQGATNPDNYYGIEFTQDANSVDIVFEKEGSGSKSSNKFTVSGNTITVYTGMINYIDGYAKFDLSNNDNELFIRSEGFNTPPFRAFLRY